MAYFSSSKVPQEKTPPTTPHKEAISLSYSPSNRLPSSVPTIIPTLPLPSHPGTTRNFKNSSCPYCGKAVGPAEDVKNGMSITYFFIPGSPFTAHFVECGRKYQQKAELESSKIYRCQKCNIKVVESGRRFGLLGIYHST